VELWLWGTSLWAQEWMANSPRGSLGSGMRGSDSVRWWVYLELRESMGKSWKGDDRATIYRGKSPGGVTTTSRIFSITESKNSSRVHYESNRIQFLV
jgi:hypothetical protein